MDTLPQEIVDKIAYTLEIRQSEKSFPYEYMNLPQLATMSQTWKRAIESITFKHLKILSTKLGILREIVTGPRKRALKSIRVEFVLPNYSDKQCGRYESPRTQRMNSHAFSEALVGLFGTLRTWEENEVGGGIVLTLGAIYSPMDRYHRGYRVRITHELDVVMGRRHDMFEERYEGSFIKLFPPERLPTLSRVSAFIVDPFSTKSKRRLANSTVAYIASRLPTRQEILGPQ
jgi:hypothetical protein